MTGKLLTKNLASYLSPHFEIPIYHFDQNKKRELPCLIVGYDEEQQTKEGLLGHYTVSGWVIVAVQGRDDADNETADSLAAEVTELLCDREAISLSLNVQIPDERPAKGFRLNRLLVRGTSREDEDSSTFVYTHFDAYTVAKD